jgi:hypothetical protein
MDAETGGLSASELVPAAAWVARGLTAYDAAYVALAEEPLAPTLPSRSSSAGTTRS